MEMHELAAKYNTLVEELIALHYKEHCKKKEIQIVLKQIKDFKEKKQIVAKP